MLSIPLSLVASSRSPSPVPEILPITCPCPDWQVCSQPTGPGLFPPSLTWSFHLLLALSWDEISFWRDDAWWESINLGLLSSLPRPRLNPVIEDSWHKARCLCSKLKYPGKSHLGWNLLPSSAAGSDPVWAEQPQWAVRCSRTGHRLHFPLK